MHDIIPIRNPFVELPADPPSQPAGSTLVVDARRLSVMLCAGIRTVRTWDAAGKLPKAVRIGGRVVWRVDEIRAWLAAGAPDRKTWEAMKAVPRT